MKDSCNDCRCCMTKEGSSEIDDSVELYVKKDGRIVRLKKHNASAVMKSNERFEKLLREKTEALPMDTDSVVNRLKESADIAPDKPLTLDKVKKVSSSLDDMIKLNKTDGMQG